MNTATALLAEVDRMLAPHGSMNTYSYPTGVDLWRRIRVELRCHGSPVAKVSFPPAVIEGADEVYHCPRRQA